MFEIWRDALEDLQRKVPTAANSHKVELLIDILLKYGIPC